ncbi:MAG: response regulator transcription factor [Gaiellales bacterium]
MSARVLVVEDEPAVCEAIVEGLRLEGYDVSTAGTGEDGLELARTRKPDVVILDWMLPGISGLDVCQTLRAESSVPIIMVTARGQEVDRVRGLELGADDYVVKPFSIAELVSRVRALQRRQELERDRAVGSGSDSTLQAGPITIDLASMRVTVGATEVTLTASEYKLLTQLAAEPGRVFTRQQIMENLWQSSYVGDARAADVHVKTLRRKLELDPSRPALIVTVRGIGYKLDL